MKKKQLSGERYRNLIQLEDQANEIESQMEEKARLIKQKNELTNLLKTVQNNIEPRRFKATISAESSLTD